MRQRGKSKMDSGGERVDMSEPFSADVKPTWTAISLTHVQYVKGDFVGFVLAWCSLVPFCILVGFATLILFRRDIHTASYLLGILLNEAVNWVLKHTIREKRPLKEYGVLYTEYGMPSSHSQFMFFFASYMAFFLFMRIYRNYNWIEDVWKYCVGLGCFVLAVLVAYSRIYLGYHTPGQVLCGCAIGTVLGCGWFSIVHQMLTPFFPYLASSAVGEFFMIRDSTLIPHVLWFEYTSSRTEARNRQRKMTSRKSQ